MVSICTVPVSFSGSSEKSQDPQTVHRPSLSLIWPLKHPARKQHPTDMNTYSQTTALARQPPHRLLFLSPGSDKRTLSFPLFLLCVYRVIHAACVRLHIDRTASRLTGSLAFPSFLITPGNVLQQAHRSVTKFWGVWSRFSRSRVL